MTSWLIFITAVLGLTVLAILGHLTYQARPRDGLHAADADDLADWEWDIDGIWEERS